MEHQGFFGQWLRERRRMLDLTRSELAQSAGCSVSALRKIEGDERRPSKQLAELLAHCLHIPPEDRPAFMKAARRDLGAHRLRPPSSAPVPDKQLLTPRFNVPLPPTPLVGRVAELAALERMLRDPQCRLLTVVGLGGVGKTRLALEAAWTVDQSFADGVSFVPLTSLGSPEFVVPAISEVLGSPFYGASDLKAQLLSHLRQKTLLLVLDGFEGVLEEGRLLAEILQQAPGVKLLVTSRERLNLQAEWVFRVHGLPVPPDDRIEGLETYSAVALFVQCARRTKLEFALSPATSSFVVRICQLVAGMPLAIELAAGWVRVLTCREITQEIERNLNFLATTARDVPERHRSLQAVFDHSWKLLSADEGTALSSLSAFQGGFRRRAAERVAGTSLPLLTALVDKSLLQRDEAGRYSLHELIRQYAAGRLRANPELESAVREYHCHYYLTLVQEREAALHSPYQKEAIGELTNELDNVRVAWEWAVARGRTALLRQTAWPLWLYYSMRNLFQEGEAMLVKAADSVRCLNTTNAVDDAAHQAARAYLLIFAAYFAFRQGRTAEALRSLRPSVELLRRYDDTVALANALWIYGSACMIVGQFQEASQRLREAYQLARAATRQWETATCAVLIGMVEYERGDFAASRRWLSEGAALGQAMGDPRVTSFAVSSLSKTAQALGQLAEMEPTLRAALQTATDAGDRFVAGLLQEQLAQVVHAAGDSSQASQLCEDCITLYRELGDPWSLSRTFTVLGNLRRAEGEGAQALRCFAEALETAFKAFSCVNALDALAGIAAVHADNGSGAQALEIVLCIQQNSAASHQAKARAAQLQAKLQARLTPQQVEAACDSAQDGSLESIVGKVLRRAL